MRKGDRRILNRGWTRIAAGKQENYRRVTPPGPAAQGYNADALNGGLIRLGGLLGPDFVEPAPGAAVELGGPIVAMAGERGD